MERFHNDLGVSEYGYRCISAKPVSESLTRVCVSAKTACFLSWTGCSTTMTQDTVSVFLDWAFPGMMGGDEC